MHASVSACVARGQQKPSDPESNTGSSFESVARKRYRLALLKARHAGPD